MAQVRGLTQQRRALAEGLEDERELLQVEAEDGLLEIAHAAVDELGRLAARLAREVAALHEGDAHPARGGVERDGAAGGAAADDAVGAEGEVQRLEQVLNLAVDHFVLDRGRQLQTRRVADRLAHGERRQQDVLLRDEADGALVAPLVAVRDLAPVETDRAVDDAGLVVLGDDVEQGRLAGSGRADDGDGLAAARRHLDVLEDLLHAAGAPGSRAAGVRPPRSKGPLRGLVQVGLRRRRQCCRCLGADATGRLGACQVAVRRDVGGAPCKRRAQALVLHHLNRSGVVGGDVACLDGLGELLQPLVPGDLLVALPLERRRGLHLGGDAVAAHVNVE
mmetsp:Transcript_26337/g.81367  ORF Transcript_26337/g.81367 Transcript_26337/m.81367 type:complete len:335 (-) Transcript_26337:1289-2293(-)